MTAQRYAEFLASPLGGWLDRALAAGSESAPVAVQVLLAHLAERAGRALASGEDAEAALELIDLVVYRLYGFEPREVETAERYLSGHERWELVERVLPLGRLSP